MRKHRSQQDYDDSKIEWLTRFEKRFGVTETRASLAKLHDARELFFEELGYSFTRRQFEALKEVSNEQQQEEILEDKKAETGRQYKDKQGNLVYQKNYRSTITGRFVKG